MAAAFVLAGSRLLGEVRVDPEDRAAVEAFFELAQRFRASEDPDEVKRLGDEMGRFVFGE